MMLKLIAPVLALLLAVAGAGLVGGPMDADINEPDVRDALDFAVAQHNKATNDIYISQVAKVIKVQKQVVSGIKYIFDVEMARTSCRKGGVEETCVIAADAPTQTCKLVIWSQPWVHSIKVMENTCK